MAQVLKQDLRDRIVEAAKEEFLENGFEKASMRNIAKKAGMTVGNLYRYFDNKEDISKQIVEETLEELKEIFKTLTSDQVSMEARVFNMKANIQELSELMDDLADRLVDTYFAHQKEFKILILHSDYNHEIIDWFYKAISSLIEQHFLIDKFKKYKQTLSEAYAVAIFSGIAEIFKDNDLDPLTLKRIISIYLNSFIVLLDSGINRMTI